MRTSTLIAVSFILVAAACAGDGAGPAAPRGAKPRLSADRARSATVRRPLEGHCVAAPAGPPSFDPPILTQLNLGTCELTLLGRSSIRTLQHVNTLTGTATQEVTFAAANRAQVFLTGSGASSLLPPATLLFHGSDSIIGGTARFDGVTGLLSVDGTVELATGTAHLTYQGWITYGD